MVIDLLYSGEGLLKKKKKVYLLSLSDSINK